jgi:hypothetical protein
MNLNNYHKKNKCKCGRWKSAACKRCLRCHNINQKNHKLSKRMKNYLRAVIVTHHKDLDRENNAKSNLMRLPNPIHRRLHVLAYNYLVKIGLIDNYISWFKRKYGFKLAKGFKL